MGKNPLQVLKGGLSNLKETVKKWKESLLTTTKTADNLLWKMKPGLIRSQPCQWEALVNALEKASDYECALSKLDPKQSLYSRDLWNLVVDERCCHGKKGSVSHCQCLPETDMGMTEVGSGPEERKMPVQEKKAAPVFTKKENATIAQRIRSSTGTMSIPVPKRARSRLQLHFNKIYPNLRPKQPSFSEWIQNEANGRRNGLNSRAQERQAM